MKVRTIAATLFLAWSWQTASSQQIVSWNSRPGQVIDITANAAGNLWGVGISRHGTYGYKLYSFHNSNWTYHPSAAPVIKIAADKWGAVWMLDELYRIYRREGTVQTLVSGQAVDIAAGDDGSIWVIGTNPRPGGYWIYKWDGSGNWIADPTGGAVRIAVQRDGTPWVVNSLNDIYQFNRTTNRWDRKPGKARSVHTGAVSGAVWVLGTEPVAGGYPIYQWNPGKQNWDTYGAYGAADITEVAGTPWIMQSDGTLYSKSDISIGTIGVTFTLTMPQMTPQQQPPVQVSGAGTLLCAAADGGSTTFCGNTNADFVGKHTVNLSCTKGFYDMIHGGTCWKCPDDTDDRGAWIRSADAVDKDTACWRVPKETTAHATKVRSPGWPWDCPSGSFWDGYSPDGIGGSCWRCPDNNPRRTANHITSSAACASTLNETRPATLLAYNGCPAPNAAEMNLTGKRSPGKPFLDIGAGGCFACPVVDEVGNVLVTWRNFNPLYNHTNNNGCRVNLKWRPPAFAQPGLAHLMGVKEVIWEQKLFEGSRLTGFLYDEAEVQDLGDATPQARAWVQSRWQEIAAKPYNNESIRTFVFVLLRAALAKEEAARTAGEKRLIQSFADYVRRRRTFIAEQGLGMYDAWKAHSDAQQSQYAPNTGTLFHYGTVPIDFNSTLGSLMSVGGVGAAALSSVVSAHAFSQGVQLAQSGFATRETSLFGLSAGLKILKTAQGLKVVSGATVIAVAFVIMSSVAIDQLMEIESARPRLLASLEEAKRPVNLNEMLGADNGDDMLAYYWAMAMDKADAEDPQVVEVAAGARAREHQSGYPAPPKQQQ